jgi:hypothetical protein
MIELVAMGVAVLVVAGAKLAYDRWLAPDEDDREGDA